MDIQLDGLTQAEQDTFRVLFDNSDFVSGLAKICLRKRLQAGEQVQTLLTKLNDDEVWKVRVLAGEIAIWNTLERVIKLESQR